MLGCKGLITMNFRYGNTYFACADQRQTKLKPQVELFKCNFHPSVKTLKHIKKKFGIIFFFALIGSHDYVTAEVLVFRQSVKKCS